MQKRGLQRLFSVAAASVLLLCCACADEGAVPAVEPEPGPEPLPEQTEPFLTVSPDTLFYDLSGNWLNARAFAVKTNCVWRLSVPEQADWFEASATSGRYDDSVSFHLHIDPHYHIAELMFDAIAADGKPVVSRSVVIQQGEKPADPPYPDDPADSGKPDDNPDKKPGDDPSNPDNPDNPSDPDTPDNPDEKPGDDPSNPDNPDNPSDPDKNPEIPPATPSIPKIESVNPTALVWSATDSGVTRQVSVEVADFDSHVLQAKISGADADRFEASVNGLTVSVKAVGTNETDADYRATLEISVEGGNSLTVSLVQSKRESVPDNGDSGSNSGDDSSDNSDDGSGGGSGSDSGDNAGGSSDSGSGDDSGDNSGGSGDNLGGGSGNDSDDSSGDNSGGSFGDDSGGNFGNDSGDNSGGGNGEEGGEPEVPQGGGCDDFSTLTPDSQCKERVTTSSGWTGSYCAVYSGDNGNDSAPYFRSLLGRDSDVKGLAMRNDSKKGGRIESPELHGGCGTLTFRYGVTEANKIVDFTVEIVRNGNSMKWQVRKAVKQCEPNIFSVDVQHSGDFRIVIRNNFSSNGAEYTTVFQIAWSGYSGNRP